MWLGIFFDLDNNCLSIPHTKLEEMRATILDAKDQPHLTIKQMQSIIGTFNHIGKAVPPARLFMSRMLDSLRNAQDGRIPVTPSILANIMWFERCLREFNDRASIPTITIEADAFQVSKWHG